MRLGSYLFFRTVLKKKFDFESILRRMILIIEEINFEELVPFMEVHLHMFISIVFLENNHCYRIVIKLVKLL